LSGSAFSTARRLPKVLLSRLHALHLTLSPAGGFQPTQLPNSSFFSWRTTKFHFFFDRSLVRRIVLIHLNLPPSHVRPSVRACVCMCVCVSSSVLVCCPRLPPAARPSVLSPPQRVLVPGQGAHRPDDGEGPRRRAGFFCRSPIADLCCTRKTLLLLHRVEKHEIEVRVFRCAWGNRRGRARRGRGESTCANVRAPNSLGGDSQRHSHACPSPLFRPEHTTDNTRAYAVHLGSDQVDRGQRRRPAGQHGTIPTIRGACVCVWCGCGCGCAGGWCVCVRERERERRYNEAFDLEVAYASKKCHLVNQSLTPTRKLQYTANLPLQCRRPGAVFDATERKLCELLHDKS